MTPHDPASSPAPHAGQRADNAPGPSFMPCTVAVQRELQRARDHTAQADLLFLERWERQPLPGTAAALRVGQIRRANPALAAEIRLELSRGRPLTQSERAALPAG